MNFFNQGIPLGKWFGIRVIVHWTFFLLAAYWLWPSKDLKDLLFGLLLMGLLFGTVLVHEFGHALSCKAVGGTAHQIILWPLGGIAFVQPPMNPRACLITTVCGPLVNAILWPVFWALSVYVLPRLNPSGFQPSLALQIVNYACLQLAQINCLLLVFNLIPGYPMDGGRILQEILWFFIGYPKSLHIAGMVGTVCGGAFIVLGFGLTSIMIPFVHYPLGQTGHIDFILLLIGFLVVQQSFSIYKQSQILAGSRKF